MKSEATEKQVVQTMVRLYCNKHHGQAHDLCLSCNTLLQYAYDRIEHCPEREHKPFCSSCRIHCYEPGMREAIRTVMRFSGPRMLFYHPIVAIRHLMSKKR